MERRDFFISYTQRDKAWAVWVANVLIAHGYTVYVQALDIRPGDNFLEKMEEFLENSENFILIWSENYSKSQFCMMEFRAAFSAWHDGRMNCLLPVRVDNCPLRRLYASLVHVDLSDMGIASEKKLMDAVRYAVPRSAIPDFLSGQENEQEEEGKRLFQLGDSCYNGDDVPQDYAKARDYWEEAAAKGNANALHGLAYLYHNGFGVKADDARAREYWRQARESWRRADKSNAATLNQLGTLYSDGLGVEKNYDKAREYYEQAAAEGSEYALYNLGLLYEYGYGVAMDYERALDYYQKAAEADIQNASVRIDALRAKLNK